MVSEYPSNLFVNWALKLLGVPCSVGEVRSGAHSAVFKLASGNTVWYLKIADDLSLEIEKLKWLQGTLPVPKIVAKNMRDYQQALLMTEVEGRDLAELSESLQANDIVTKYASALKEFHSKSSQDCPFKAYIPGTTLVHGDACLPNILFSANNLSGFVDLGDMGLGDVEVDLSAAIWSLQFNLGRGYGSQFLEAYGYSNISEAEVERLKQVYESSPIFQR
ncbi:phosphotransferase [Polaromonas sp.]|nr:phosphotransferase [Candidatus Saccharibacteria bacterium]